MRHALDDRRVRHREQVGGPEAQPESSQSLSEGMGWANYHLFSLHGGGSENFNASEPDNISSDVRRSRGPRGRRTALLRRELESEQNFACRLARENSRELGATVLVAAASISAAYLFREAFVHIIFFVKV